MKLFLQILGLLSLGMIVFNIVLIDFNDPLQGDSLIAIIGVMASGSSLLLLCILYLSLKIKAKQKNKKF